MKLCIGLCDDNPLHLRMIAQELRRLCEMREIEAEIHPWDSGAQLLKDLESYEIQLYILDIRMPGITGIEVAKQINLVQPSAQISFISRYLEYFSDVYETEHLYFVLKSQMAQRLPDALDRALNKLGQAQAGVSFMLRSRSQVIPIPIHSILCIEKELRKIIVTTTHDHYEMYAKLQEVLSQLPPDEFFQCHRSYIVAFRHIEQICGNEILLSNGKHIPDWQDFYETAERSAVKAAVFEMKLRHTTGISQH